MLVQEILVMFPHVVFACRLLGAALELITTRPGCLEPPALASLAWAANRLGACEQNTTDTATSEGCVSPSATAAAAAALMEPLTTAILAKMDRFSGQVGRRDCFLAAACLLLAQESHA
jgi:hypothetical protein